MLGSLRPPFFQKIGKSSTKRFFGGAKIEKRGTIISARLFQEIVKSYTIAACWCPILRGQNGANLDYLLELF